MRRTWMATGWVVAVLAGAGALALEGLDGTTVTGLFDGSDVQTAIGWTDQEVFGIGASSRRGDALAGSASGDVYFLVHGETPGDPEDPNPLRTALVQDDGTDFTELLRHVRNQGTGPRRSSGRRSGSSPCRPARPVV